MRSLAYSIFIFAIACGLVACSRSSSDDNSASDEWKEMDEFHTVMADLYHPLKDSGNLEPIRNHAGELAASAEKWADTEVPEKVDNNDVRNQLLLLKTGTRELADLVNAQAPDSVVSSRLTELHDTFHSVMEAWYHEGEHHKH
jgi:hypothetical protein